MYFEIQQTSTLFSAHHCHPFSKHVHTNLPHLLLPTYPLYLGNPTYSSAAFLLRHFSHLPHISIKTHRNSIHRPIFLYVMNDPNELIFDGH